MTTFSPATNIYAAALTACRAAEFSDGKERAK